MIERRTNHNLSNPNGGEDRRSASRYDTGPTYVVLSWTEGETLLSVVATLRDISLSGGSALAKNAPCVGTMAWFRLQGDDTSPWVAATIVAVSKTGLLGRGPRLIRWKFPEACPYLIFKAAINGFSASQDVDDVTMPGYTRRDWRG
ncbi:hypothetical protein SAMN05444166_5988 [Singulisphaera sp. GP187]|uniref:hypothetical protein n=1 Tax=Singulisphaera sp. GP187 TaxID=1882752 RepID=UPI00092A83F2|nr:hypothetical protein [Singulisphaera sp. GP187]SIO59277.1 hypothetical protein SAMN05444166_5988 [Singulisphaera sp. GP187]